MNLPGLIAALFLLIATLAAMEASAGEAVYYLFRHAEKVADVKDPGLTEKGMARAEYLAERLQDKGVTHIFSSDYIRTRETVTPLSKATGIPVEIYDPRDLEGFAGQLRELEGVIVVSGHSNSTPELTALISGKATEPMDESEYDRLYQVHRIAAGEFTIIILHQDVGD
ncbi:MAG: histidine phosphatase family protein [Proteobacteria bacterium]|nr:histidine phosphatase family protein [Pseudomonadota bacterium]